MEQSKLESKDLFKRLLAYHFYRDLKSAPEAVSYLNKTYNNNEFISLRTIEGLYSKFDDFNFDFDDLCKMDFHLTLKENDNQNTSDNVMVVSVTPSDDLPALTAEETMINEADDDDGVDSSFSPQNLGSNSSLDEENESDQPSPLDRNMKKKRGRPQGTGGNKKKKAPPKIKKKTLPFRTRKPTKKAEEQSKLVEKEKPKSKKKSTTTDNTLSSEKPSTKKKQKTADKETDSPSPSKPIVPITLDDINADAQIYKNSNSGKMTGYRKQNIRRRQLYLHCFEAKYSATEAANYLNSVYGESFTSKNNIGGWYRRFRKGDFDLDDRPRCGRSRAVNEAELDAYMQANPMSTVAKLCEVFKCHRKTMMRVLHRLSYHFVTEQWEKFQKPEVTDRQLCEYKLRNSEATIRQIAEHFQINRSIIARRLRALGFDIPKWPVWSKKKFDPKTGEWTTIPQRPAKPGENLIKRSYKYIMDKRNSRAAATATQPEETENGGDNSLKTIEADPVPANGMFISDHPMLELAHLDAAVQRQISEASAFSGNLSNSTVNRLLPAVLRHKNSTITSTNSILNNTSQQSNMTSNSYANLVATTSIQQSIMEMSVESTDDHLNTQNTSYSIQANGQQFIATSLQQNQGFDGSGSFQTIDSAQVQSLLHPYYM